jgi:hypothetical protein
MNKIIIASIVAIAVLAVSTPAYAYLDPGTGSVLLQGLLAGVASALAVLKLYWRRFKSYVLRLIGKNNSSNNNEATESTSIHPITEQAPADKT